MPKYSANKRVVIFQGTTGTGPFNGSMEVRLVAQGDYDEDCESIDVRIESLHRDALGAESWRPVPKPEERALAMVVAIESLAARLGLLAAIEEQKPEAQGPEAQGV